jgi:putative ABC transport system permease protein
MGASSIAHLRAEMTFFTIVVRGLLRRRVRTGLTLVGISIGIAAVVALVGIARGFERSWEVGLKARGTDVVVSNMSTSLIPKPFSASIRDRITGLPQVSATCALLVELMSIENSEMMILSAREWGGFAWENLELVSGRMPRDANEPVVVLGQTAAEVLQKKVGDPLQIEATELSVAGIVKGGALVEDGSVILSLSLLQEITGNQGRINVIDIRVPPSATEEEVRTLCEEINRVAPEVRAVSVRQHLSSSQGYRMVRAMSWGTSLLAVLVGVLGVMNTMLMTVFERTQEICVLLALGWKRSRIVRLILCESALLGFLGGVTGIALGAAVVRALQTTPAIRGLLDPDLSIGLLTTSVVIAVFVGVLSGLYPAWYSSQLTPGSVLRG